METKGYNDSFSILHSTAYSYIGFQTAYLATHWDPIYWNTACLIVNSGSLENLEEENQDDKTTDYVKMAKAIGDIKSRGVKMSLVNINESDYSFEPDEANNEILFGLKGINKIGAPVIAQIIKNRPYKNINDFMIKCPLNKTQMISLIKAGAFDKTDSYWAEKITPSNPRYAIMAYYITKISGEKTKLNLQNFNGLIEKGLIPKNLNKQKQFFLFNKYLKKHKKNGYYLLDDEKMLEFYSNYQSLDELEIIDKVPCISETKWNKIYKDCMDTARDWLKENQDELLRQYNDLLFKETWDKYALGNISAWEMESLCFYYHEHELKNIDNEKYGIQNFFDLSYTSEVDYYFKRGGKDIPIFKLSKIAGTVIGKDNARSLIYLLTKEGVVTVKFTKEYYAMYNRQLSQILPDGTKKVLEKGWFTRGMKLLITGYRREDTFVSKKYKATASHQLYKIIDVQGSNLLLEHERVQSYE